MTSHVDMSPDPSELPARLDSQRLLRMPRLSDLSSKSFWIGDYVSFALTILSIRGAPMAR